MKNKILTQPRLALLLLAICSMLLDCKKREIENLDNLIADGCIPQTIIINEPIFGESQNDFIYENDRLVTGFNNYNYEYKNGMVNRIRLGDNRYEDYLYNDDCKVIQSIQYRRDDPDEDFNVINDKQYEYNGELIFKVIDNTKNLTHEISYYPNTNNIDSIKTLNDNLELIELNLFQYDQSNNVYKNLLMPKFNFYWWIEKNSNNNITQRKIIKFTNPIVTLIYNYEFAYNNYNYPIEINMLETSSNYYSNTTITYLGCM